MNTPAYESTKENYQLLPKAQLIALINQRMFGRKSEAHPNPDQGDLFTQPEPKDASVATVEENPNAAPPSDSEAE